MRSVLPGTHRVLILLSFALAVSIVFASQVRAQVAGATLSGTINDPSGAVVPKAQVSARNTATGVTRAATTDSAGFYSIPNLLPGNYEVSVTAPGFSTAVQSNIELAVGAQQQLNIAMKIGETTQKVQVTEAAPAIQLTSSTLSGEVQAQTVRELPLNGRDWTQLATLQPGVDKIETQMSYDTSARGNRGFGSEYTISGGRTTFNNYRIDGISVVDYANAAPGDVIGVVLGVDAIQEFSVLTGGFSAEYGRAAGGVVNAVSKSGTNTFHGDAYEFLRNSALDSNDFFNVGGGNPKPPFRRNQFGGSAGGPIVKDKTFIFGDYEGLRQTKGIPTSITVPSDAARTGLLTFQPDPKTGIVTFPGGCVTVSATTCQVTVAPYPKALLALYPHANSGVSGSTGKFIFSGVQAVPENFGTIRLDHRFGDKDSLFGTYLVDDADYTQPDKMNLIVANSHTRRQTVAIEETHTFGTSLVNAARIGYNRDKVINQLTPSAINPAGADLALGSTLNQTAPRITISSNGLADEFGGINSGSHYLHAWNSYQFYDDANWIHGAHSIKIGAGVEREQYNPTAFQNPGGRWKFSNLTNFLRAVPKSFEAGLPNTVSPREMRQTIFGAYVQDDWRFRPNLTLNLGLRYEMATVLHDAQGKFGSLVSIFEANPNITADANLRCGTQFTAPVVAQAGTSCDSVGPYYKNPTLRDFEPRLGFAWDPFRNGKTSVRGGFGMYDVLPLPGYFLLQQNQAAPFMVFKSVSGGAVTGQFSAGNGQALLTTLKGSRLAASTIETNPHRSYVMQWDLNIQRQLASSLTLTLGYVGSHGVHLLMRGDDGNMTIPTLTSAGYLFPAGGPQINQALGVIRYIYWNSSSNYNGFNVNLEKRFSHGFQAQFAYTFGKSLDDDSQTIAGDTFGNGLNSPMWFLPKTFYGPSDYDVRHSISVNGLWDIPAPKSLGRIANSALGGWEMGGIFTINNGVPTTPIISDDPLGLGNTGADQFGLPNIVAGCNPVNSNWKANNLTYINVSCFTLPQATPAIASQCQPFGFGTTSPIIPGTCANLLGNVSRNSIYGPRLVNLDFSVLKNFPVKRISEAFNIQFRAEMFNILNRPSFVPPQPGSGDGNSAIFGADGSPSGGSVGQLQEYATTTPSREIQFALKFVW